MTGNEIRSAFLEFFRSKGHAIVPSSSLIPVGDPSVLFTSAGMQQFKPYYSGEKQAPHPRVATAQKCVRMSDIDVVGDASHLTFFEMLGNFAFADYFKQESIEFAWELLTRRLGLRPDRIWATCFGGEGIVPRDEESAKLWQGVGVPAARIKFFGRADNFWGPTGDRGPCGPCTEIHYELRAAAPGHACMGPNCECERFLELWNLVFNQYYQAVDGALTPLKSVGVDTGAGLERWAVVLQDKPHLYETDLFAAITTAARRALGTADGEAGSAERAVRIVTEHTRSAVFMIADGVLPGNEGRGYVLRRLLRRVVGQARLLGRAGPVVAGVAEAAIATMGHNYPEVLQRREHILRVVEDEEDRFGRTLSRGLGQVEAAIAGLSPGQALPGETAFLFHDTYGVPFDLVRDVAAARSAEVDEAGFRAAMQRQREQSRAKAAGELILPSGLARSEFTGYGGATSGEGLVTAVFVQGERASIAQEGDEALVVLDRTPFYAEAGGQVGDSGALSAAGLVFRVADTQSNLEGAVFHRGTLENGRIVVGAKLECAVDAERRFDIARNHTATHLLHAALRGRLGGDARQSGSLVSPDHLRFDFTHGSPLAMEEIVEVERVVNDSVLATLDIKTTLQEVSKAVAQGALALFGEAYGDIVRMVRIGDISKELCGGTHLANTAQIGSFAILHEESVGSGLRRIEAVTGRAAARLARRRTEALQRMAGLLNASVDDVPARVSDLLEASAEQRRELGRLRKRVALLQVNDLVAEAPKIGVFSVVAAKVSPDDPETFKEISDSLRSRMGRDWAFVLGAEIDGRPLFFAAASDSAVSSGADAGKAVRAAAEATGGGGGGRPQMANGGGRDPTKLRQGIDAGYAVIAASLGG